jgi:hypothetical protein
MAIAIVVRPKAVCMACETGRHFGACFATSVTCQIYVVGVKASCEVCFVAPGKL